MSDFQRDGLGRVTSLVNEHLTADMAGSTYGGLGSFTYTYDSGGNVLTADNSGIGIYLAQDTVNTYDTGDRLLTMVCEDFRQCGFPIERIVKTCYAKCKDTHRRNMIDAASHTDHESIAIPKSGTVVLSLLDARMGQGMGRQGTQERNSPDCP